MSILHANGSTPLYLQLYEVLSKQIQDGTLQPGDKLPSEDALRNTYGVSRVTVRSALLKLVEEGVLVRTHGKGTFVASTIFVESSTEHGSFTESCLQMNVVPGTKLIKRGIIPADKVMARVFDIEIGRDLICLKRLRLVDNVPAIFEIDYFHEDFGFMLDVDVEYTPMLDIIKKNNGLVGNEYMDTFEVKYATKEQADWLLCPPYSALLAVSQVVYTENRKVLYYNEQLIRSDIYKYVKRG